ncbi:hypothetical protein ACOSP7_019010 [Xanthoceras sorbifolium]
MMASYASGLLLAYLNPIFMYTGYPIMSRYICYFVVEVLFFCEFRTLVICEDCCARWGFLLQKAGACWVC